MKKILQWLRLSRPQKSPSKESKLREQNEKKKAKITQQKALIEKKDARIDTLHGRVQTLQDEVAQLRQALAAAESAAVEAKGGSLMLHQIATTPYARNQPAAGGLLADVLAMGDPRGLLSYRYLRGNGLEIGALAFPLPLPPQATAKYYDYRSAKASRRAHPEIPPEKIVEVDYVGDGEKLDLVADDSLDFLVANHMLEHCQDFIGTLRVFYRKVRQEGVLFITLPDLRYTFDFRRQPTRIQHLERDHAEGPQTSLYAHYVELMEAWPADHQKGIIGEFGIPKNGALMEAEEFAGATQGRHVNWHFHAWTQKEMLEAFVHLSRAHGFIWEIEATMRLGIEFILVLRKTQVASYDRNHPAETTAQV